MMTTQEKFTAKDVQALRQRTGAGMMESKKALEENNGDMDKAAEYLRTKGIAKADKRVGKQTSEIVTGVLVVFTAMEQGHEGIEEAFQAWEQAPEDLRGECGVGAKFVATGGKAMVHWLPS